MKENTQGIGNEKVCVAIKRVVFKEGTPVLLFLFVLVHFWLSEPFFLVFCHIE